LQATRIFLQRSPSGSAEQRRALVLFLAIVSLLVLLPALWVVPAHADEAPPFRLIVHPDSPVTSISRESLADAFLKISTRWEDGETIRAVDQRADSPVRKAFSDDVLRRSVAAVRSYWQQRIFSGRDLPPPEMDSDDAVIDYVLGHRGGVGYVSPTAKLREAKALVVR